MRRRALSKPFVCIGLLCVPSVFAGDAPVYSFAGVGDVEGREAERSERHSSAGYFQFVESTPADMIQTAFRVQRGLRLAKCERYWEYVYIQETPLPDDVFVSAVVPNDEKSKIWLLRDLGKALHLDIRLEKRELPCWRITDPQKPYPDSWVDGADYLTAEGRLSHLPIYCVVHRMAERGSHPTPDYS